MAAYPAPSLVPACPRPLPFFLRGIMRAMSLLGTLRSWPRRIRDSVRQEGLPQAALRLALSPLYRSMVFTVRPLATGDAGGQLATVAGGFATQGDIDTLARLNPRFAPAALRARLEGGERCYLASIDGKTVSCRWVRSGEARLGERDPVLRLCPDEAYVYQIYVRRLPRQGSQ